MAPCSLCLTGEVFPAGAVCPECKKVVEHVPRNIPLIAEKIGVPEDKWTGNCHGISLAFIQRFGNAGLELPGARLRRGYVEGYGGQHSWIELNRGIIVDPTISGLLEGPVKVVVTNNERYDPCGWHSVHGVWRVQEPPTVDESEREPLVWEDFSSAAYVGDLLHSYDHDVGEDWLVLSSEQAMWLANLPVLEREGPTNLSTFFAAEIYERLNDSGLKGFIPIDAWHYVMDEPYRNEPARPK